MLAYELSKKHVELHPFFSHLEQLGLAQSSGYRVPATVESNEICNLRQEMSPILVKLCDTVLRTIDLASLVLSWMQLMCRDVPT